MAQLKDTHVDGVLSVGACEDVEAELSKLNSNSIAERFELIPSGSVITADGYGLYFHASRTVYIAAGFSGDAHSNQAMFGIPKKYIPYTSRIITALRLSNGGSVFGTSTIDQNGWVRNNITSDEVTGGFAIGMFQVD